MRQARSRGIELLIFKTTRLEEIPVAIDAAKKSDAAALNVLSSAMLYVNRPVRRDAGSSNDLSLARSQ